MTADPWPHPWPKGGRPPKIANAVRWNLYVDSDVRYRAMQRAAWAGTELPDVMRALMADYAAGLVVPSGQAPPEPEEVTPAQREVQAALLAANDPDEEEE